MIEENDFISAKIADDNIWIAPCANLNKQQKQQSYDVYASAQQSQ